MYSISSIVPFYFLNFSLPFFTSSIIVFSTSTALLSLFHILIDSIGSSVFSNLSKFFCCRFSIHFQFSFFVPYHVKFMLISFLKFVYALINFPYVVILLIMFY